MSPPKSLDDLLREFDSLQISSPSDRAAIDKAIEANKWAKKVQSRFGIFCMSNYSFGAISIEYKVKAISVKPKWGADGNKDDEWDLRGQKMSSI